jgi:perosamine synthetase
MNSIVDIISTKLRTITQKMDSVIPLHEPFIDHEDAAIMHQVVLSGWVSYQGEMVKNFEQSLESYLNVPYVISIVNGTSALFLALRAIGVQSDNEIIVPSLTFAATANAVLHAGAIPHFVDACRQTLAIDLDKLENYLHEITFIDNNGNLINKFTKRMIKAIIPVYVLGSSFDIERLQKLAKKFHLSIIEDAAEALGSEYKKEKIGSLSGIGILSFNGNKIITTGGGGAIAVKDEKLAHKLRHLSTTAKKPHKYEFDHDEIGYNLRLPALNAALGYSQMKKLNMFLKRKENVYQMYLNLFSTIEIGTLFNPHSFGESNNWLNAFILNQEHKEEKNTILNKLNERGIGARPFWKPLHLLGIYKHCPRAECSSALDLYERSICLPSSVALGSPHA